MSAACFEPTRHVWARLKGEAFSTVGLPAGGAQELNYWEIHVETQKDGPRKFFVSYHRNDSWFEGLRERWWPHDRDGGLIKPKEGPALALLHGGSEAKAVLQALNNDRSRKIRQFARVGLGLDA